MLVDDELPIIRAGETMLRRLGYQPFVFTDPEQAREAFRRAPHEFDVVITDLTMPRLTGVALTAGVVQIRRDLPVILTTGYMATFDLPQAR